MYRSAFLAKSCTALLLLSMVSNPVFSQKARVPRMQVEKFSIEQGLSDRKVSTIAKDRQGFLWMATDNGLNRFDGYDFLTYDSRPRNRHKIRFNKILALLQDRAGHFLIHYYENSAESTFGMPDLLDPLTGRVTYLDSRPGKTFPGQSIAFFQAPDQTLFYLSTEKERVTVYQYDEAEQQCHTVFETRHSGVDNNCFTTFLKATDGTFWFAYNWQTERELLVIHADAAGRTIRQYRNNDFALAPGPVQGRVALTETAAGEILFTLYPTGVYVINPASDAAVKRHPLLPPAGYYFAKDRAGNLLAFQTQPADPAKGCYLITTNEQLLDYSWVFDHQVVLEPVYSDDFTLGLLAGSGNGFNIYRLQPERFKTLLDRELGNAPYGMSMRGMAKLGRDKLFIATELDGLYELDLNTNALTRPGDRLPQLRLLNQFQYVRNLFVQGDTALWMPGREGVLKYVPARNALRLYRVNPDMQTAGKNEVWGVAPGKAGMLWLIPRDGRLVLLDPASGALTTYRNKDGSQPLQDSQPSIILAGRDGAIWVGTTVSGLFRIDLEKGETQQYTANPGDPSGFNSNHITALYEDAAGLLWVCTMESGLHKFDPKKGKVTAVYSRENGLRNNNTVGILPDGKGNYWVSTFSGLSYLDTKLKTFRNFTTDDGLTHNEFNRFSYFFDRERGRFYFGGMNGVNIFDQKENRLAADDAPLLISEMSVSGPNGTNLLWQEGIVDGSALTLPPGSRFFRLSLALGNYFNTAGNQFSYKIDGLDQDWNYLGANRELRIDQLPAGRYTLHLRGADDRGNWSRREITLHLTVQAFWYKTWWAWLLFACLLAGGLFYGYRFQLRRRIAEKEALRLQQLDAFKNRFFTNITHEFRTPLTVILGTAGQLAADEKQPGPKTKLSLIKRSGENLLRLINQILDLAKLESNTLKLDYIQGDILPYLRYIAESLHSFANARNVLVQVKSAEAQLVMDFDPERLLQLIHNLLTNAIKFTPSGGRVVVELALRENELAESNAAAKITVSDTGVGIPPEDLSKIFDRFYQAENQQFSSAGGTGIGLSLTKELVTAMGGQISVKSTVGQGTTFTVLLPVTNQAPFQSASVIETAPNQAVAPQPEQIGKPVPEEAEKPLLLVVEDNPDVVEYLAACLTDQYQLEFAYNGRAGIEKALELIPDILVSDIMMPEKDGFELCDVLKNNEITSHIPIVLLTAKVTAEDRISGLRRGADAYLGKPFHPEELLVTLENLLELRKKLQAKYGATGGSETPEASPDPEDAFLARIRELVLEKLSDTDFGAPQLERALRMSRSQIFRKIKALTGKSPTLFVRSVRLAEARRLLESTELSVSEIAYDTGFSSPQFFSDAFLEEFGVRPSAVRG